jgi:hypothetical protein
MLNSAVHLGSIENEIHLAQITFGSPPNGTPLRLTQRYSR